MYKITIVTIYNIIEWVVEDYKTIEVEEVLNQPYVKEYTIEEIKGKVLEHVKRKANTR